MQSLSLLMISTLQPAGPAEPGILHFFGEAGLMAKVVLAILTVFSLVSWAIMIGKALQFSKAKKANEEFLRAFHRKGSSLREIRSSAENLDDAPLAGVFRAGYAEIENQIEHGSRDPEASGRGRLRSLASLERSLQRAIRVETTDFSRWSGFLATTAAATPFIGLFGTVWGIMVAFGDIGLTGSTSLVTVAPGIAEALINTAAGLAAAIPALIGYNYFAQALRRLRTRLEDFALELLNLSERNFT